MKTCFNRANTSASPTPSGSPPACKGYQPGQFEDLGSVDCWESVIGTPPVMRTDSHVTLCEKLRNVAVRWAYRRHTHRVTPGLYALGDPDANAPVLVTANYKLTFDSLRLSLKDKHLWILVLDTKGINVWCAAGKGSFGTTELIHRIMHSRLAATVNHRTIILPQLGAPGIAAHEIEKATGFRVRYGPVYARDLPDYIAKGFRKSAGMSRVHFPIGQRMAVVPVELVHAWKLLLASVGIAIFLSLIQSGSLHAYPLLVLPGSIFVGTALFAALLPFLPTRAFASRGALLGAIWSLFAVWITDTPPPLAWPPALIATAFTSYLAMNFTGCSTFTSQKGTEIEVRASLPWIILSILTGTLLPVLLPFLS